MNTEGYTEWDMSLLKAGADRERRRIRRAQRKWLLKMVQWERGDGPSIYEMRTTTVALYDSTSAKKGKCK